MARPPAHTELDGGVPPEGDHRDAKHGHHDAHRDIGDGVGVGLARLELERAVVACQQAGEADEHLAERRVDVEVELALEVVAPELAKVRLVPHDGARLADLVEPRPAREQRVQDRRDVLEVLLHELALCACVC